MACHTERSSLKETAIMKKTLSIAALFLVAMTGNALANAYQSTTINAPSAKVGARAVAAISVQPQGPYHINLEYPAKLTIDAPGGVTLEKAKQTSKDAVKFAKSGAELQVAFMPQSAGKKLFTGELKFAVCDETTCVPQVEKISFTVDVK
jgi:hypothetical protein